MSRIEQAIAQVTTPNQARQVLALADAAVAYATSYYKENRDVIQRARSIKLQAERKLGEVLAAMPKAPAGRPKAIGSTSGPIPAKPPTLADLGIDKKLSARAQKLAAVSADQFAAVIAGDVPVAEILDVKKHKHPRSLRSFRAAIARAVRGAGTRSKS